MRLIHLTILFYKAKFHFCSLKIENSCYGLTRINEEKTPKYQSIEELAETYPAILT